MNQQDIAEKWSSIGLTPCLLDVILNKLHFENTTPVQASTIPLFIKNKDVVVEAVTGSGKTLAFVVPVWEMVLKKENCTKKNVEALIISPTRELAQQTFKVFNYFVEEVKNKKNFDFNVLLLTGGNGVEEDLAKYKSSGGHIIVGTPGKVEDFIKHTPGSFKNLEVLVMDEADRLLDMGFEKALRNILSFLPKQRRTGLFSATMSDGLSDLVKAGLRNPVKVIVKVEDLGTRMTQRIPSTLAVNYVFVDMEDKLKLLINFLKQSENEKVIVFFATCACVDYFHKIISELFKHTQFNRACYALHGKMVEKKRRSIFECFSQEDSILFTTDVAARGIDVPDVDLVIQFDPPQDPQSFLHRCGRTARQGKTGKALIFLQNFEDTFIEYMTLKSVPMQELKPSIENIEVDVSSMDFPEFYKSSDDGSLEKFVYYLAFKDRDMYQKSIIAFTSYLRSYQEHQLKYIFPFKKLDLTQLLNGFYLLHLPKCPEAKLLKSEKPFVNKIDLKNISEIKFLDPNREKQRLSLEKKQINHKKKETESWSHKKEAKQRKVERKEKKILKKEAVKRKQVDEDDLKELEEDYKKIKQLKKAT